MMRLDEYGVDLHWESLEVAPEKLEFFLSLLQEDERARANRFHFPEHRRRFIAARGILRLLLGEYLQLSPQKIEFIYNDRGKPALKPEYSLHFNLSHSQDLVFYGFSAAQPIGVDLEYLRSVKDVLSLAERFFCPAEAAFIRGLVAPEQENAFFRAWTAKEAYLKATGEGLAGGLEQVEVVLSLEQPLTYRTIPWRLLSVEIHPDYANAIAIPIP